MKVGLEAIHMPACGLDVHKDKIDACIIDESGLMHQKTFSAMRNAIYSLKAWILSYNCMHVLMESTGVYWLPVYEILEEVPGIDVGVGNSRHMKNVPGRPKTDKHDSRWISKLCMFGLILKSFVTGRKFRELREYTRYHKKLVQDRARQVNRIEKLLQMNGFKLSSVLSDITGKSGMKLLKKLSEKGSVSLDDVKEALHFRVKKSPEEIEFAINGQMKLTSRILLSKMISRLESCDKEIADIYQMMLKYSEKYKKEIKIIQSIPGMGELSAIYIIAEISTDMSSFKTANHIASWAGLAPKDNESAGKQKAKKTQKANIYIKSILVECAWAATRTRKTRLSNWYWRNSKRLGEKKAITAVARKLLCYIYAMLKSGELYDISLDAADENKLWAQKLESVRKKVDNKLQSSNVVEQNDEAHSTDGATILVCDDNIAPRNNTDEAATLAKPKIPETANNPKVASDIVKPARKRGRPRKTIDCSNKSENTTTDCMPLETNDAIAISASQNIGISDPTNINSNDLDAIIKPSRKRGRPRKTVADKLDTNLD